jgi:hypothetical protein
LIAYQAGAPSPGDGAVFVEAGIDNLVVKLTAIWALHGYLLKK